MYLYCGKMKKVTLILLITLYSLSTVGFSLKEFYCCGKLKSVTVALAQDTKQKCSKGNEKSGCCNNKYQSFKIKDKHVAGSDVKIPTKHFTDLILFTRVFQLVSFASQQLATTSKSHAPPLHTSVPIYIYNSVFRI